MYAGRNSQSPMLLNVKRRPRHNSSQLSPRRGHRPGQKGLYSLVRAKQPSNSHRPCHAVSEGVSGSPLERGGNQTNPTNCRPIQITR